MDRPGLADTARWISDHDPLAVVLLLDPVIDKLGHDVDSHYVESYWLPILGPSAIWVARQLLSRLYAQGSFIEVPLVELSTSIGLGHGTARNAPIVRTLTRLVEFGLAATGGSAYAIRPCFPPLPARLIERLPEPLAASHRREMEATR